MNVSVEEAETTLFHSPEQECDSLYFLLRGKVAVSRMTLVVGRCRLTLSNPRRKRLKLSVRS